MKKTTFCFVLTVAIFFFNVNSNAYQYTFVNYTDKAIDVHLDSGSVLYNWCEVLNLKPLSWGPVVRVCMPSWKPAKRKL